MIVVFGFVGMVAVVAGWRGFRDGRRTVKTEPFNPGGVLPHGGEVTLLPGEEIIPLVPHPEEEPECTCSPAVAHSFGGVPTTTLFHEPGCATRTPLVPEETFWPDAQTVRFPKPVPPPPPDPYLSGWHAGTNGGSIVDCPYPDETPEATAWLRGFARLP